MILVIGATGWTGSEATRLLVACGEQVRALTRDRAKAEEVPALVGAEIVVGDSGKPETLDDAFAGADKVFLVPPTDVGWDRMQEGLIDAARRAGVRHVVKLSAVGVSPDQPSMSLSYHWKLEASGLPGWMAKEFADIYGAAFHREGGGAHTTGDVQKLLGRPPRRYDDFARDYRAEFA